MAKGRKLTTSRSERFLGGYSYGHSQGTADDTSELGEEEVWAVINGGDDRSVNGTRDDWSPSAVGESNSGSGGSIRSLQHDERHVGGLSLAFQDPGKTASPRIVHQFRNQDSVASPRARHVAASAPVNAPKWSKIYRVNSVESCNDSDDGTDARESEMVPPHEYLAREYGKMAENSVFEGVGRTLKGRDMSRVRDAVWSQTGFDG